MSFWKAPTPPAHQVVTVAGTGTGHVSAGDAAKHKDKLGSLLGGDYYKDLKGLTPHEVQIIAQMERMQMASAQANAVPNDVNVPAARIGMLCVRLRCDPRNFPFKKFHTEIEGETVYVFVVKPEGPVTLTDSLELFPSDTLIAQLRLLA